MSESVSPVPGISREQLESWLAQQLRVAAFRDYCPNGLQVAGKPHIHKIVTGVTASMAFLEAAVARRADAVLVHHGWFWKNDDPRVVGLLRHRLAFVLKHDLNLFAYHLPLDAHPQWGNNAQLGKVLGLVAERAQGLDEQAPFAPRTLDEGGLVWVGGMPGVETLAALQQRVHERLGRAPLVIGEADACVGRVAWCTGGAQGYMQQAIAAGASVYITGEISEYNAHLARESGTAFVAAGHHATERYGVQALGQAVAQAHGLDVEFIDIDNPA